jgi:hypothetical protein
MRFGRFQVRLAGGGTAEFPLDIPAATIGSAAGSTIQIDDPSVAARHARVVVESGRVMIEDLGSESGTFIAGERIVPGQPRLLEAGQQLRIGNAEAIYLPPAVAPVASAATADEPAVTGGAVRISVSGPPSPVQPGDAVFATITVQNRGHVVDQLAVSIPDLPAEWLTFSNPTISLLPGQSDEVTVVIRVPRDPSAPAGERLFTAIATSSRPGESATAGGQFTIARFEDARVALEPVQGKGDFHVRAANAGNAVVAYGLSGSDDEERFEYEFDPPAVTLQPGDESRVALKVSSGKRRTFGKQEIRPFRVLASPTTGGEANALDGRLVITPAIENWKRPAALAGMALLIGLIGLTCFLWPRSKATAYDPESPYAGVHMCGEANTALRTTATAKAKQTSQSQPGQASSKLFAQNDPQWAKVEYAKAADPQFGPDWCGKTIEECGCAMTSVATIMALFEILTMPDGQSLNPKSLNDWFNLDATKTNRGWVSRGYVYGDVVWTAAGALSAQIKKDNPSARTIRFLRTGRGSEEEIRAELAANRPIILEVPGHWIAAIGLEGDRIKINDPYYKDRQYLDVYAGKVKSSVIFEPSSDLGALVVTVTSGQRVRITDEKGRVVGTLSAGTPEDAEKAAQKAIPGSSYNFRAAWRDPNCVESPPTPGAGTNQLVITQPGNGRYKIEVLDPDGKPTNAAFHIYDKDGKETIGNSSNSLFFLRVGPEPGVEEVAGVKTPGVTTPGTTTSTVPAETTPIPPGPQPPQPPQPPSPPQPPVGPTIFTTVFPPTVPGQTVTPPTATLSCQAISGPGQVYGACNLSASPPFDPKSITWTVNGVGIVGAKGQTSLTTPTYTSPTTVTVGVNVCNQNMCSKATQQLTLNPGSPITTPVVPTVTVVPTTVTVSCPPYTVLSATSVRIDCEASFTGPYNTISWTATGATPTSVLDGTRNFSTFRSDDGLVTVTATVCLGAICQSGTTIVTVVIKAQPTNTYLSMVEHLPPSCSECLRSAGAAQSPPNGYLDFTVQVTSGAGMPAGSVRLIRRNANGTTTEVSIPVDGTGVGRYRYPLPDFDGITFQSQGVPWTFTAKFVGDRAYQESTSNSITWPSSLFTTSTYLSEGTGPVAGGFRLTGRVYSDSPLYEEPQGSVRFTANGQVVGTVQLDANGRFTFVAPPPGGATAYVAQYLGDAGHSGSSDSYLFAGYPTTTTIVWHYSLDNFEAHVFTTPPAPTPSGTVNFVFRRLTPTVATVLTVTVPLNATGFATVPLSALEAVATAGTYSVQAVYAAQGPFGASQSDPFTEISCSVDSGVSCYGPD